MDNYNAPFKSDAYTLTISQRQRLLSFGSPMSLLLIFVILTVLSLFLVKNLKSKRNERGEPNLPPSPRKLPIIGNLHQMKDPLHRSLHILSKQHGQLMHLQLGKIPALVVSSASMAMEFLKTHDLHCCSRPKLTSLQKLSYGGLDIAFAPYSENWRELRKISIVELFSSNKVSSFERVRAEEMERFLSSVSSMQAVNLSEMLSCLTNNVTCRVALGMRYDEKSGFREMLSDVQGLFVGFFIADFFPGLGFLDVLTGMKGKLDKVFREFDDFYERMINERLLMREGAYDRKVDLLDTLLDLQNDESTGITRNHIKGVLMNIFVAGTDTSSALVEWAMVELIRNPKSMNKAQSEVRRIIGSKGKVEEKDLHKLQYLNFVLKETMRLHPPAALLIDREVIKAFVVDGYLVEPKTRVIINAWSIGRDETNWENPEEFCPERFIGSSINTKGHDYQLIPFGSGRRLCPGMNMGMVIAELALANLLYAFNCYLLPGLEDESLDMEEAQGITVKKKKPLRLMLSKQIF